MLGSYLPAARITEGPNADKIPLLFSEAERLAAWLSDPTAHFHGSVHESGLIGIASETEVIFDRDGRPSNASEILGVFPGGPGSRLVPEGAEPLWTPPSIAQAFKPEVGVGTGEFGPPTLTFSHTLEGIPNGREHEPNIVRQCEQAIEIGLGHFIEAGQKVGVRIFHGAGTHPGATLEHTRKNWITPPNIGRRYSQLDDTLCALHGGRWQVPLGDAMTLEADSVAGLQPAIAEQHLFFVTIESASDWHDDLKAADALIKAGSTSGTPVFGCDFAEDPRLWLWRGFVGGPSRDDMPPVVMHDRGWWRDKSPADAIAKWFRDNIDERMLFLDLPGSQQRGGTYYLENLEMLNGMTWTLGPRPKVCVCQGKLLFGFECRLQGMMPTIEFATTIWANLCLARGIRVKHDGGSKTMTHRQSCDNREMAFLHGPKAQLHFLGEQWNFGELCERHLDPLIELGHRSLGLADETLNRYMPCWQARRTRPGSYYTRRWWQQLAEVEPDAEERGSRLANAIIEHQERSWQEWPEGIV